VSQAEVENFGADDAHADMLEMARVTPSASPCPPMTRAPSTCRWSGAGSNPSHSSGSAPDATAAAPAHQSDVVRLRTKPLRAEGSLTLFHRFPSFFNGSEVPSPALGANDPEPAPGRVEREPAPDRQGFDSLVLAQRTIAVQTREYIGPR
jgi:hypothetical protein